MDAAAAAAAAAAAFCLWALHVRLLGVPSASGRVRSDGQEQRRTRAAVVVTGGGRIGDRR